MKAPLLLVVVFALTTVPGVQAKGISYKGACFEDSSRLCPTIPPGTGRMYGCLRKQETLVRDACKAEMNKRRARFDELLEACKSDLEKFCGTELSGPAAPIGAVIDCLNANKPKVSKACTKARAKLPANTNDPF